MTKHGDDDDTSRSSLLRTVTLALLRKRSEHNEGSVSTLEELALHQEELEAIGPVLGRTCGATLRILLLQNNVIVEMGDLRRLKRLEYLNLALNNVEVVTGLAPHLAHSLHKLDLTLNFVSVQTLGASVAHLQRLHALRELYLLGNPCCGWEGCRPFVVASLPQLTVLDGTEITRSERITALQRLPRLTEELRRSASKSGRQEEAGDGNQAATHHNPRARAELSAEMAQQKAEQEAQQQANQPRRRGEYEFEREQDDAVSRARERELRGDILQCNEPKLEFRFDEETKRGSLLLDLTLPKFLSSSLVDVDVHPTYVSIVVKAKTLRLRLPAEVRADDSTARRSTTTGHLLVTMPKVDPHENMIGIDYDNKTRRGSHDAVRTTTTTTVGNVVVGTQRHDDARPDATMRLDDLVVLRDRTNAHHEGDARDLGLTEVSSKQTGVLPTVGGCEDEPPPVF